MFRLKIISDYRPNYKNTQWAVLCKLYFGFEMSNLTADMYIYSVCVCVCVHTVKDIKCLKSVFCLLYNIKNVKYKNVT